MQQSLALRIAELAVNDHYVNDLPKSFGKPKAVSEWTVFAAIVAASDPSSAFNAGSTDQPLHQPTHDALWVVASATGTKCTARIRSDGSVLHDSHAEVLCRRGLMRVLWTEILNQQATTGTEVTQAKRSKRLLEQNDNGSFQLRPGIQLYMYISDSPCGDATIYPLAKSTGDSLSEPQVQFTGAKIIVPQQDASLDAEDTNRTTERNNQHVILTSTNRTLAREPNAQSLGSLRSKSGRSNLAADQRSSSMSCSDKLLRWNLLGLQGGFLSKFITDPIVLSGIVVGRDPRAERCRGLEDDAMIGSVMLPSQSCQQLNALQRAIPHRMQSVLDELATLDTLPNNGDNQQSQIQQWIAKIKLPHVLIVDSPTFVQGKAAVLARQPPGTCYKRKRDETSVTISPSGLSLNWQQFQEEIEVTVGARGIRHGTKPKSDDDFVKLKSRVSRAVLSEMAAQATIYDESLSYRDNKELFASQVYLLVRRRVFETKTMSSWLLGSKVVLGTVPKVTDTSTYGRSIINRSIFIYKGRKLPASFL